MDILKRFRKTEQLYCSVDLEFTGFDPSRDRILEIGFAFFRVTENGAEITEQWSQVFKPSIEVHPKILGLTGITLDELDAAPDFNEHREFIQGKLRDCIIVGHNPTMDVKFLESYGIKLSGKTIDTLELVQFLLPTHHSYNLENLMHYFGIAHPNAHRALGDAISTISVLENLMRIYQGFDENLQNDILDVCTKSIFLWEPLLHILVPKKKNGSIDSLAGIDANNLSPFFLSPELVSIDEVTAHHDIRVALGLQAEKHPTVLVVEDPGIVMRLWKNNLVHGLFGSEDLFDGSAFTAFKEKAATPEELRFCLKVMVWLRTNWQTETVLDLNISFFGGQFRQFIIGGTPQPVSDNIVCCDYKTFQQYAQAGLLKNRRAVITNVQGFERFISSGNGTHVSWNGILYNLRSIYNPESDYGNHHVKREVLEALAGTDLFFALVFMLLHHEYSQQRHVSLPQIESEHGYMFNKLSKAAHNLKVKLERVQALHISKDLQRSIDFLQAVFGGSEAHINADSVEWVTIDEHNSSFHKQPLDVAKLTDTLFKNLEHIQFTETITQEQLLSYHVERLGLNIEVNAVKGELNKGINKQIESSSGQLTDEALFAFLSEAALPAVIVMPDLLSVKNFYNKYYAELKVRSAVFAQGYSGGGNKMFRNYSIKQNSILLATPEFISRQKYVLAPSTIVFTALPHIDRYHPYVQALINHWQQSYPHLDRLLITNRVCKVLKKLSGGTDSKIFMYGTPSNEYK